MSNARRTKLAVLVASLALSAAPLVAAAATPTISIVPACARNQGVEAPSLVCALQTFGNIAQLILGLSGALVLVMFVWGGFQWLTAFGDPKKVDSGKTIIRNAIIGLAIVLVSGSLINYGMAFLVRNPDFKVVGASCDQAGNKSNPNGQGVFVQTPDGKITCVQQCTTLPGYQCVANQSGTCVTAPDCKNETPYCCRAE